jgi:hypothetical protein
MILALLLIDWNKLRPESIFGGQVLERTPAGMSIVYIIGVGVLLGFLVLTFYDNFNRPKFLYELDLPREVKKRLTQTVANRSIRVWQVIFVCLAFTVFGFQVYWTYFADESNEQFRRWRTRTCATGARPRLTFAVGCSTATARSAAHSRITNSTQTAISFELSHSSARWLTCWVPNAERRGSSERFTKKQRILRLKHGKC